MFLKTLLKKLKYKKKKKSPVESKNEDSFSQKRDFAIVGNFS